MSQRGKRQHRIDPDDNPQPTKRRKGRPPSKATTVAAAHMDDDDPATANQSSSQWQPRLIQTDLKISSIYNRSAPEAPAELFRKDLISAMKLPDSEPLAQDEYWLIVDQWKQEWERGVQVPVNPDSLPEPCVSTKQYETFYTGRQDFKLPKNKFIRITKDETFSSEHHYLSNTPAMADAACSYDLDQCDEAWLQILNGERAMAGMRSISEEQFERVIEELEVRCWDKIQAIMKSEEGLGIEYDENVICDVCRSPDSEEANEMVFCDSCNICVHQACYGILAIPSGQWLCRTCSMGQKPDCVLCPNKGGAMKSARSGQKWAHVSCALWIPEVSIGSVDRMEPITKISSIPPSRWALICVLCRERVGACIQCSVKTCKTAYHVTCAFQHGLEMRAIIEDDNAEDQVKLRSYCQKHSMNKSKKDKSVANNAGAGGSGSEDEDNKRRKRKDMTTEERNISRVKRLQEVEAEFDKHVNVKDISCHLLDVDQEAIHCIYNYWLLKRKSGNNRPLLPPKSEDVDMITHKQEQADIEKMKMFVHLRQDLERVRNLCYMVSRREKLSRSLFKMREQTFHKQIAVLTDPGQLDGNCTTAVYQANHGPSIYDRLYSSDTADNFIDLQLVIAQITGIKSMTPHRKDAAQLRPDLNGLTKKSIGTVGGGPVTTKKLPNKTNNIYPRFLNGTTRTSSIYASSLSSDSETDKRKLGLTSSDDETTVRKPESKKKQSPMKTPKSTVDRRKRGAGNPAAIGNRRPAGSSSDEDIGGQRTPARNRLLRQMERELVKDKMMSGSDSDELVPIRNSSGQHIGAMDKKISSAHIYSDSDSTDKEKTDNTASDSQQYPLRTKAAMKEFNMTTKQPVTVPVVTKPNNLPVKSDKSIIKETERLERERIELQVKLKQEEERQKAREMLAAKKLCDKEKSEVEVKSKGAEVKVPSPDKIKSNRSMKSDPKPTKDLSNKKPSKFPTDLLVVPQRQAAKKASENMMRTTVNTTSKQKDQKDEEIVPKPVVLPVKEPVVRTKGKQPTPKPIGATKPVKESKTVDKPSENEPINKSDPKELIVAYVPQRQAAKKAAEHIKSGLGKPIPTELVEEKTIKPPDKPSIPTATTPKKEDGKKPVVVSSESSSESSSSSSSYTSSSSSSDSEEEDAAIGKKKPIVDEKSTVTTPTVVPTTPTVTPKANNKPQDLPFLNKGLKSRGSVSSRKSSDTESDTDSNGSIRPRTNRNNNIKTNVTPIAVPPTPIKPIPKRTDKSKNRVEAMPKPLLPPPSRINNRRQTVCVERRQPITVDRRKPITMNRRQSIDTKPPPATTRRQTDDDLNRKRKLSVAEPVKLIKPIEPKPSEASKLVDEQSPKMLEVGQLEKEINERKAHSNSNKTKTQNSGTLDKLLSRRERDVKRNEQKSIEENHQEPVDQPKDLIPDEKSIESVELVEETISQQPEVEIIDITDNDEKATIKTGDDEKGTDVKSTIEQPIEVKIDKIPEEDRKEPEIIEPTKYSSIFSPQPIDDVDKKETNSIFEFPDEVPAFPIDGDQFPSIEPPLSFGFATENLFKQGFKEDSAKETMDLVGKLRQKFRKSNKIDQKSTPEHQKDETPIIDLDTSPEGTMDGVQIVQPIDPVKQFTAVIDLDAEESKDDDSNRKENQINRSNSTTEQWSEGIPIGDTVDKSTKPIDFEMGQPKKDFINEIQEKMLNIVDFSLDESRKQSEPSIIVNNTGIPVRDDSGDEAEVATYLQPHKWADHAMIQTRRSVSTSPGSVSDSNDAQRTDKTVAVDKEPAQPPEIEKQIDDLQPNQLPSEQQVDCSSIGSQEMNIRVAHMRDILNDMSFANMHTDDLQFGQQSSTNHQPNPIIDQMVHYNYNPVGPVDQYPNPVSLFQSNVQLPYPSPAVFPPNIPTTGYTVPADLPPLKHHNELNSFPYLANTCTSSDPFTTVGMPNVGQQPQIPVSVADLPNNSIISPVQQHHQPIFPILNEPQPTVDMTKLMDGTGDLSSQHHLTATKSPIKSPEKSPLAFQSSVPQSKQRSDSNGTKSRPKPVRNSTGNNRSRGRNGRGGRGGRALTVVQHSMMDGDMFGGTHTNLAGTVYDFDFDEDFSGENIENLRAMRERRKSIDTKDVYRTVESPKFGSPQQQQQQQQKTPTGHRMPFVTDVRDLRPPSPIGCELRSESVPVSVPQTLHAIQPLLPGPVDMRTYNSGFDHTNSEAFTSSLLGAFASGTADQTLHDIDEEMEKELQSALKASNAKPVVEPPPVQKPPPIDPVEDGSIDSDIMMPHSKVSLFKLKIKGPHAHPDNYNNTSVPVSLPSNTSIDPQPIQNQPFPTATSTPGTSNLRRMRKKELLRQYWTQENNLDDSNTMRIDQQPNPALQTTGRSVGIPKAVDSMSSIPTKDDYKDYTSSNEVKKRKVSSGISSREIRQLDINLGSSGGFPERRRSVGSNASNTSTGNGSVDDGKRKTRGGKQLPHMVTPKLKIKIGAGGEQQPIAVEPSTEERQLRPPKKRLSNMAMPTLEDLKRESMNFRKQVMGEFDKERKKGKSRSEKKAEKKKRRKEKERQIEIISNESETPKIIIRFGKRKTDESADKLVDPLALPNNNQTQPIRLKLARNSEGKGYVMATNDPSDPLQLDTDEIIGGEKPIPQESVEPLLRNPMDPLLGNRTLRIEIDPLRLDDCRTIEKSSTSRTKTRTTTRASQMVDGLVVKDDLKSSDQNCLSILMGKDCEVR